MSPLIRYRGKADIEHAALNKSAEVHGPPWSPCLRRCRVKWDSLSSPRDVPIRDRMNIALVLPRRS